MKMVIFSVLFFVVQLHAEDVAITAPTATNTVQATAAEVIPPAESAVALKDESQIPLKLTAEKKEESSSSSLQKFMLGAFVLTILLFGAYFFLKKYSLRNIRNDMHQIKILTQHHLGPRKSLAILRVAGESILVGITDHNISMIKSLSLLDEDIPQDTPKKFDQTLFQVEKKSDEEFTIKGIHEHVRTKLKEMKGLS